MSGQIEKNNGNAARGVQEGRSASFPLWDAALCQRPAPPPSAKQIVIACDFLSCLCWFFKGIPRLSEFQMWSFTPQILGGKEERAFL